MVLLRHNEEEISWRLFHYFRSALCVTIQRIPCRISWGSALVCGSQPYIRPHKMRVFKHQGKACEVVCVVPGCEQSCLQAKGAGVTSQLAEGQFMTPWPRKCAEPCWGREPTSWNSVVWGSQLAAHQYGVAKWELQLSEHNMLYFQNTGSFLLLKEEVGNGQQASPCLYVSVKDR